jgi:hypothetical protein
MDIMFPQESGEKNWARFSCLNFHFWRKQIIGVVTGEVMNRP